MCLYSGSVRAEVHNSVYGSSIMPIPGFDAEGLLPVGNGADGIVDRGHDCSYAEVEEHLVGRFPSSVTRPALFRELEVLAELARERFRCFTLLISGEFVTNSENPHSIYVAVDVLGDTVDHLEARDLWLMHRIFDSRNWEWGDDDALRTQTGFGRSYPENHHLSQVGVAERNLIRSLASMPADSGAEAGFLEIFDCEGGLD
jgi:hypothetical protein